MAGMFDGGELQVAAADGVVGHVGGDQHLAPRLAWGGALHADHGDQHVGLGAVAQAGDGVQPGGSHGCSPLSASHAQNTRSGVAGVSSSGLTR
ncbi:hypothetical protein D3C72_2304200 [compost metagenome]